MKPKKRGHVLTKIEREKEVLVKKAKLEEKRSELRQKLDDSCEGNGVTYTGREKDKEEIKKIKRECDTLEKEVSVLEKKNVRRQRATKS